MIHKYNMNGYNIVLDINSGAVHVVDDAVYSILDYYENFSKDDIFKKLKDKFNKNTLEEAFS